MLSDKYSRYQKDRALKDAGAETQNAAKYGAPMRPDAVKRAMTALIRSGLSGWDEPWPSTCSVMRSS